MIKRRTCVRRYRRSSHTRYDLKVHLIFSTKYRHNVMTKSIAHRIREIIRQICESNDIQIIKGVIAKDHLHLYVSYPPKLSVSNMIQKLKGHVSRKIQQEFPQLGEFYWGKHFWSIGYGAFSSGHVTDEMVREYLDKHDKRDDNEFIIQE